MPQLTKKSISHPRFWRTEEVAAWLGMSVRNFQKIYPALVQSGFPARDELVDRFDSVKVERWADARSQGQSTNEPSIADILNNRTRSMSK